MSSNLSFDRRTFLIGSGSLAGSLFSKSGLANEFPGEALFASAFKRHDGSHGVVFLDGRGQVLYEFALPGRGHDVTICRKTQIGAVFARRPGNFALIFDLKSFSPHQILSARDGRHFYGHGVFSVDGKLLYATENDFDGGTGVIGVYDATDKFKWVGEFSSYGIGPHELLFDPLSNYLVVANGGIETHPDFGRAKLNIPTMEPSLAFIDPVTGELIEKHALPANLHKLSTRHMAAGSNGKIIFGCQFEGSKNEFPPLVGSVKLGEDINLWQTPEIDLKKFGNYVGSLSISDDQEVVAVTMPKGDRVAYFSTQSGQLLKQQIHEANFGVASYSKGFGLTAETGKFSMSMEHNRSIKIKDIAFDNHLTALS